MSIQVKKIEKKIKTSLFDIVKFQLLYEISFKKKDIISNSDLDILVFLAVSNNIELSKFCTKLTKHLYKTIKPEQFSIKSQNIRNRIGKMIRKGYIVKDGIKITISPDLEVIINKNMLLIYNLITIEANKA